MTIQALLRMLTPKTNDTFLLKQFKRYEEVKKDLAAYTKDKGEVNKIHPEYVMSEIDKLSSDDAVFTVDTGTQAFGLYIYLGYFDIIGQESRVRKIRAEHEKYFRFVHTVIS